MKESLTLSNILDENSYRRFTHLPRAHTIELPKLISTPDFKFKRKGRRDYIIPSSDPIDFQSISNDTLLEIWSRFSGSNFDPESLEQLCPNNLKYEIMRTYYALSFWEDTPGAKRYTKREILKNTLLEGPTYAEKLSDEWDYGIRREFRIPGLYLDFTEWKPIKHFNELPPIAYLIRWKESITDIEYMSIPLAPFNTELLEELRNTIMESLPDSIEVPKDVEILSKVKTSTTLDLDKMKSIPFYKGRLSPHGSCFSRIFKARRTIVPVGPANTRDAVVTTIDTYNSVKWCDLVIGGILDTFEESLVVTSPQEFNRKLEKMSRIPRRGEHYWLRDIKKCGLTFPRELILLIQDCLRNKFPEINFDRFDIYNNYIIYDENSKPIKTVRGYCLGMANNCVTFIQCMLYRMLIRRLPPHIEVEALVGNDDSCLKVWVKNDRIDSIDSMMIQEIDFELLQGLNIITNDKKSFWSWWPIIFEEYGHLNFKKKDSRLACALSSAMLAADIKYAKLLTSSLSLALWEPGDWLQTSISRLTEYWGFEFYPDEVKHDYSLGGWFNLISCGCSIALRQVYAYQGDLRPLWGAVKHVEALNKQVLRPVLEGTVTENYSVLGSMLNITYVDTELYDIPELPVEMIYLNRKSYEKFYESIYRFNRTPYKLMASRLRRVTSIQVENSIQRESIIEFLLSRYTKLAIPEELVSRDSSIFEKSPTASVDCFSLMRNCLSRYVEYLRINKILTCTPLQIDASGEYPYVSNYDRTPYTSKVEKVTTLSGNIPKGIYQYSTNPWLPLNEYVKVYDRLPLELIQLVPDKKHLPEWFMNKPFRNSHEISVCYSIIEDGEEYIDYALELLRDDQPKTDSAELFPVESLCWAHSQGFSPWEEADDIFNIQDDSCMLCIMEDTLWRTRKTSQIGSDVRIRTDALREVPIIKSRIKYVITRFYPLMESSLSRSLQEGEGDIFSNAVEDDDGESIFAAFGIG